ncbi:PadR family transcriptional regulator [Streptococcus gallolyticus]|uniref:Transcriptional regulator, PadR family n=1 Tax=Streptococcus gallolyticus TaxID=315405 RepID=A0A1H9T9H0_9STRE|nr:PadR family transcriptional regulator [Streptococcus gallolyticus]SER93862.1 transcriptional regulator, PadR family [Streptococcus gallolyticus]
MYFPTSATVIEFLILAIVDKDDSYGYAISQTIKQIANIKESTLYPILKKLEKAGYLTTYQQAYQGRKRKYYAITDTGKEQLSFLKKEWQQYKEKVDEIIEGRLEDDKS